MGRIFVYVCPYKNVDFDCPDESFIQATVCHGEIYSLEEFQDEFNKGSDIDPDKQYIRFIER